MTTTSTDRPSWNVFEVIDEEERKLILEALIQAKIASVNEILHHDSRYWNYDAFTLYLPNKIAALANFQIELQQIAQGQNLEQLFLESNDGKLLTLAWNAILNGDLDSLSTLCAYAPQDIERSGPASKLFRRLVTKAGITMLSECSASFREQHGSYTFVLDKDKDSPDVLKSGLYIAYDTVADSQTDEDKVTSSSAILIGTLVNKGHKLETRGEANQDPLAVKAMAQVIADKIKAHYKLQ